MNLKRTFIALLLLLTTGLIAQENRYGEEKEKRGLDERWHQDEEGRIRPDLFHQSKTEYRKIHESSRNQHLRASVDWQQYGPAPATVNAYIKDNGQLPGPNASAIIDLAIDPNGTADDTVYAVVNSGGVWKTTDGGNVWTPKTDFLQTLSFGAIALDPRNSQIVYAGTGNDFNNGYYNGTGIFKSEDGGDNWDLIPSTNLLFNGICIIKMIVPNPDTILVATNNGYFTSFNGSDFVKRSVAGGSHKYISDLDYVEESHTLLVSVKGEGIFKTQDFGVHWDENLWDTGHGEIPTREYGFVSLGVSNDGQKMYANAELFLPAKTKASVSNPKVNIWKSIDGGQNWSNISAAALATGNGVRRALKWRQMYNCQCGYDQTIGVDPQNSDRVYMGFQDLWLTEDGGASWVDVSLKQGADVSPDTLENMHVDHHALVFSPPGHRTIGEPTRIWVGNDGGVWSSQNAGTHWANHNADPSPSPSRSFASNLFRGIGTGRGLENNKYTYGGMQDMGTAVNYAAEVDHYSAVPQGWNEWTGGDGGQVAVDWTDPSLAYGMWNYYLTYTHDAGETYHYATVNCEDTLAYFKSTSRLEVGPTNRKVYATGKCWDTATIYCSVDSGKVYNIYYQFEDKTKYASGLAVCPTNENVLYVSLKDGSIYRLNDNNGTVTATEINIYSAPSGKIPQLTVNQKDASMVLAVYPGYTTTYWPQSSKHVFLSRDAGSTWKDISGYIFGSLIPDFPIYTAEFDPNTTPNSILVGSDFGVFRSFDFGMTWHIAGAGLPHVVTTDLEVDATVNPTLIKAGTYGRSTWGAKLAVGEEVFGRIAPGYVFSGSLTFVNDSYTSLELNTISDEGDEIDVGIIQAGDSLVVPQAFYTGVYVVRNNSSIVLVYAVSGQDEQRVLISQASVDIASSNVLRAVPGIRSYPSSLAVPNMKVHNQSSVDLDFYRISKKGKPQYVHTIRAGEQKGYQSIVFGEMFTLNETNGGAVVSVFTSSEAPNQTMYVNDMLITDPWLK